MVTTRRFSQVNVFSAHALRGNPLAVVHDADGLDEETLAAFARWTNLSETTFLLTPSDDAADYRVRIFTTTGELPFAGHPTLGSAHAWLEAGGEPRHTGHVVQECGAGLVTVSTADRLAFAAPPLTRSGPLAAAQEAAVRDALRLEASQVRGMAWIDNGPGWIGVELAGADEVLAVEPDPLLTRQLQVGVIGRWPDPSTKGKDVEVRAFYGDGTGVEEDPVTGSLNAGLAQWLITSGRLPQRYVAGQGARLLRDGRVYLEQRDGQVWVGGDTFTTVSGQVRIG
ncbi:MAG: PhzF family phenazine biosynthesis protein [Ornithinimicrobium sp.]|uniref:PhzF family phenazine biosynthesis protein n=1 Tax=Ornithinimicrobium sp. TaxID=1977084 RepID=UPI0026DF7CA1|nr:PhzF family phenazine biosynthesis protein [Ornithinimicrobium sp.]MDO5738905.1 PhzF family phenazine biosynthesis protein [Ornithinimicrobium sp.]